MMDGYGRVDLASREEVFEQVREILVERLDVKEDDVNLGAHLRDDLEADSLDLVELIMDLEERFGVKISDEEAQSITTVGEAVDFISERAD
jgi:acyl carrier protein